MNDSELRSEDSLQSVKYLGKERTLYTHGIDFVLVSREEQENFSFIFFS